MWGHLCWLMRISYILFCTTFVLSVTAHAAPPPVEAFGQLPRISDVQLSPDGTHFSTVEVVKGRRVLVVYDLDDLKGVRVLYLESLEQSGGRIRYHRWVNPDRLVLSIGVPSYRGATPVVETRLISTNRELNEFQIIPKPRGTGSVHSTYASAQIQDRIAHWLPKDPNHVLIFMAGVNDNWKYNVYKVNVNSGAKKRYDKGVSYLADVGVDELGRVRYQKLIYDDIRMIRFRLPEENAWTEYFRYTEDEGAPFEFIHFGSNDSDIVVAALDANSRFGIYRYDFVKAEFVETIFTHQRVDAEGVLTDLVTDQPIGYYYTDHYKENVYTDAVYRDVQKGSEKKFPGLIVSITSADRARNRFVIFVRNATDPGRYYLFDRAGHKFQLINSRYRILQDSLLFKVRPVSYAARDGLPIAGYLTTPRGPAPFPLIAMPHGGPTSRDTMHFDYWAQFLASRGYAVFQPNFRGSSGFGQDFEEAGYKQWGLAMQDDITDGVQHLVAQGIADPDRICIVGGSYGGYAALMGVVRTPDLYKCAVAFAPVTDIHKMLSDSSRYRFQDSNMPHVGGRWSDGQQLRDTSPINNINSIKAPILLVHGDVDRSVPIEHSERMAGKLKRAKKSYRFVRQENGDHHLSREDHRIQFLTEMERFLAEHLQ